MHLAGGLPSVTLGGLPEPEVKEARERVRAALQNSGFEFPAKRITINLAPADLPKESGRFDLPIALGILAASRQIPGNALNDYEFAGELSLSGDLRPIRGALAMVLASGGRGRSFVPVSYTHLDVYKRQALKRRIIVGLSDATETVAGKDAEVTGQRMRAGFRSGWYLGSLRHDGYGKCRSQD